MKTGDEVGRYTLGPQIGQGGFGNIFTARDNQTGLIYALKNESKSAERKTLHFESRVLRRIQDCPYFPKFFDYGETNNLSWIVIELIGPSLTMVLKSLPQKRLSLSTGIRTSYHVLAALKALHGLGFIHRDIKPGNVLIRMTSKPEVTLCDFGLARIYRDQKTGEHIQARTRTGFRGTPTYASINAHINGDLSRRDDLISWFYFTIDILGGQLPWKNVNDIDEVTRLKQEFDAKEAVQPFSEKLYSIWEHITSLSFEGDPNYDYLENVLKEICQEKGINPNDPFDWDAFVESYKTKLADAFGVSLRIDTGGDQLPYYAELGLPPVVLHQLGPGRVSSQPLLNPKTKQRHNSSMELSELNEKDRQCPCIII